MENDTKQTRYQNVPFVYFIIQIQVVFSGCSNIDCTQFRIVELHWGFICVWVLLTSTTFVLYKRLIMSHEHNIIIVSAEYEYWRFFRSVHFG